ncbi:MAG: hypothetical protein PHW79_06075 [Candidatus Marinimicrobia bacterium]|nr:hypothetical protein [Candidatus Neomarinimicrobiota bacterium]
MGEEELNGSVAFVESKATKSKTPVEIMEISSKCIGIIEEECGHDLTSELIVISTMMASLGFNMVD